MAFKAPYVFKVNNREVVIQHKGGGSFDKHLRVNGENAGPNGGQGKFARWIVELQGDDKIKLKSKETGKYLRIEPNAKNGDENKVDVKGVGGKWTVFKVHKTDGGANQVKLESAEQAGKYLAVQQDNKIRIGNGGPWTVLRFFREGAGGGGGGGEFSKPYEFAKNNTVIIGHRGNADKKYKGKQIRVTDGNEAGSNGGKGKFAQLEAEVEKDGGKIIVSFKAEGGGYLRIQPAKNVVNFGGNKGGPLTKFIVDKKGLENGGRVARLQSKKDPSKYVSVKANGDVNPGTGGIFTELVFFRKN